MENNIVEYIEDKDIKIDKNWFYHGSVFSYENYHDILTKGIVAPNERSHNSIKYNYIFVSKKEEGKCNYFNTAFSNYMIYPRFILSSKIKAISPNDGLIKRMLKGGNHGLKFTSLYPDEYQVYKKIVPQKIIGIAFDIGYLIKKYPQNIDIYLDILYKLSILLTEEFNLPIIDVLNEKEINKTKVLKLTK